MAGDLSKIKQESIALDAKRYPSYKDEQGAVWFIVRRSLANEYQVYRQGDFITGFPIVERNPDWQNDRLLLERLFKAARLVYYDDTCQLTPKAALDKLAIPDHYGDW